MTRLTTRLLAVDPQHPDRWWTRLVFWHAIVVCVWIGLGLILTDDIDHRYTANPPPSPQPGQPRQHPISSLGALRHVLHIGWLPWNAVAGLFFAIALGLLFRRTRAATWLVLAGFAAITVASVIAFTYISGSSTNQITVPISTFGPDLCLAGFRYSKLPLKQRNPRAEPQR